MLRFTSEESLILENYSEDDYRYLLDENCLESLDFNEEDSNHPESQKKLVLAAKIGKFLLEKIRCIEEELNEAKSLLASREQEISYLKQKLSVNETFIQSYSRTSGYEDDDIISSVSSTENISFQSDSGVLGSVSCATVDSLTRRIRELEEENYKIKQEALQMSVDKQSHHLDEHDSALVRDCLKQVKKYNENYEKLREELNGKIIANNNLYTQYLQLNSAKNEIQNKLDHVQSENEMIKFQLKDVFSSKEQLAVHYKTLYDKYDEIITLYNDCRKQLQTTRRRLKKTLESNRPEDISESLINLADAEEYNSVDKLLLSTVLESSPPGDTPHDLGISQNRSNSLANELLQAQNDVPYNNKDKSALSPKIEPRKKCLLRPTNLPKSRSVSRRHSWDSDQTPESNAMTQLAFESDDTTPIRELLGSSIKKTASVESLSFTDKEETQTMISDEFTLYRNNRQKLLLVKPMSGSNVLQKWQRMATTNSLLGAMPSSHKGITVRGDIHQPSMRFETKPPPLNDKSKPLFRDKSNHNTILGQFQEKQTKPISHQNDVVFQSKTAANSGSLLSVGRIHALFNAFLLGYPTSPTKSPQTSSTPTRPRVEENDSDLASNTTPRASRRALDQEEPSDTSSSSDSSRTKSLSFISTSSKGLLEAASFVKRPSLDRGKLNQLYEASLKRKESNTIDELSEDEVE